MPNSFFLKNLYYLTHSWGGKRIHTFPKGINPKVNLKAPLEFELANYEVVVQHFISYVTETTSSKSKIRRYWLW